MIYLAAGLLLAAASAAPTSPEVPFHVVLVDTQNRVVAGATVHVESRDFRSTVNSDSQGRLNLNASDFGAEFNLLVCPAPPLAPLFVRGLKGNTLRHGPMTLNLSQGGTLEVGVHAGGRPVAASGKILSTDPEMQSLLDSCGLSAVNSGQDGGLRVAGIPEGGLVLDLEADGFVPAVQGFTVGHGAHLRLPPIELQKGSLVLVMVQDDRGSAVVGADIEYAWFTSGGTIQRKVKTTKTGTRFLRLPNRATIEATVSFPGMTSTWLATTGREFPEQVTILRQGGVRLQALDGETGEPVDELLVRARRSFLDPPSPEIQGLTRGEFKGENGFLEGSEMIPGLYDLELLAPGYFRRMLVDVEIPPGEPLDLGGILMNPGGVLAGQVIDQETEMPLENVSIHECKGPCDELEEPLAVTGPDGRFRLHSLSAASMRLLIAREGYAASVLELDSDVDSREEEIEIQLAPGGVIAGKVVDPSGGRPISNAAITVTDNSRSHSTITNNRGRYEVPDLAPGKLFITKFILGGGNRGIERRTVEIQAGMTLQVDFGGGGRVSGVVRQAGIPLERAAVMAFPQPQAGLTDSREINLGSGETDRQGGYVIAGIEAGPYWLQVEYEGMQYRERFDVPGPGQEVIVDIDLPEGQMRGQVLDDLTGEPLAGVQVTTQSRQAPTVGEGILSFGTSLGPDQPALAADLRTGMSVTTDGDGRFEIPLPNHGARVGFGREGYIWEGVDLDQPPSGDIVIRLLRDAGIRVRVRNSFGEPVTHGDVYLFIRLSDGREMRVRGSLGPDGLTGSLATGLDPIDRYFVGVSAPGMAPLPYTEVHLEAGREIIPTFVLGQGGTLEIEFPNGLDEAHDEVAGEIRPLVGLGCLQLVGEQGLDLMPLIPTTHLEPGSDGSLIIRFAPTGLLTVVCDSITEQVVVDPGAIVAIALATQ